MITLTERARVIQNIGLADRMIRLVLGAVLLGAAYYVGVHPGTLPEATIGYFAGIAIYPLMTSMLGWDPLYALTGLRSCGDTGRNLCGSMPYELKAMSGHAPRFCDTDVERSLEACHDDPAEHPHHKVWRVDVDPVLYPDDKAWHRYFARKGLSHSRQ